MNDNSWIGALSDSFKQFIQKAMDFIPDLIGAIVILAIGWIIAILLGNAVKKLLRLLQINRVLEKTGANDALKKIGITAGVTDILGGLVKWFVIIIAISAALNVLQITQVSALANELILYIPDVIAAFLIFIVGLVAGKYASQLVENIVRKSRLSDSMAELLGSFSKWAVIVFALMSALVQLGIADEMIQILFAGLVIMMAIAGGIGLGLGSKDKIKDWLDKNIKVG